MSTGLSCLLVREGSMRSFWNDRAREDALFFVDNRLAYGDADSEAFWRGGEDDLQKLLDIFGVEIRADDTVVDIGCGVGRLTRAAAARARELVSLDVSDEMLARAGDLNADLDNVTWVLGDGHSLDGIGDAVADVCVSLVVFQHIPDPTVTLGYLQELGRVLKPGGRAVVQVSNDPAVHQPRASLGTRLRAALGRAPRGQGNPAWLGSAIDLDAAREAVASGGAQLEGVFGEGTQFCELLIRRPERPTPAHI